MRPGPLVPGTDRGDRPIVRLGVGPGVVGQDALDSDALTGEPDGGVEQRLAGAAGALIGHVGYVREAAVVVDHDLEVVVERVSGLGRDPSR